MPKLNKLSPTTSPSVMLFGAPFTGKSLLAGKLAEHFNLIYVDMEDGHDVLFQLPEEWQEKVEVIELPDTSSYPIAIETCLKMVKMKVKICWKHGKVGCPSCSREYPDNFTEFDPNNVPDDTIVIFDSSTQLTSSAINHITKAKPDDYKLEYDDWGSLGKLMDVFFSHIQNAPYKCIVISHVTEAEQEDGKKLLFPVAGSRNFSTNVAKFFDHVVYLERKNKKHLAASSTKYHNGIMSGSRTNAKLEDMDEHATLLSIFAPDKVASHIEIKDDTETTPGVTTKANEANPSNQDKTKAMLDRLKKQNS